MLPTLKDALKNKIKYLSEHVTYIKQVVTIEPLLTCALMAKMISIPALTNLEFEQACKVNAGFSETICDAIVNGTYLEKHFKNENNIVQHHITTVRAWEVPLSSIFPVILILFLGSYSDRHKIRKPFLLMPLIGGLICTAASIWNVFYMHVWSLELLTIYTKVIPSLFGSEKLLTMIAYAYIADISSAEMMTIRMATIPLIYTVCIPTGQAISGMLFRSVGYMPIFAASFVLYCIALLNGLYVVKEPLKMQELSENSKGLIKDIFNVAHVIETFRLLTKKQAIQSNGFYRLLIISFIDNFINTGENNTFYMFTQAAYQWTVIDYTYLTATWTLVNFIGYTMGVPLFSKTFAWSNVTIMIISNLDGIFVSILFVLWKSPLGLYIACTCMIIKAPGRAASRSEITRHVSRDDTAKAFSLTTLLGAVASVLSAEVYIKGIYEATREAFPQAFFLLSGVLYTVIVIILSFRFEHGQENKDRLESTHLV